ncbi:glycosyltransferase family protein [Mediterranea massiliensis]|uniref:oligosaccharide biosynthesis protein Alg14 n=1 Tax=Mediterranea massiliensis TaxID=1841865 RepID=UPI000933EEF2|nr:oligosaccharide biosynthesis protein Alg14 [Mediterranea massiliensis]
MKTILAVASIGGHWIQLLRIVKPLEAQYEVVYMSTHPKCKSMVKNCRFHTIIDFSRWDIWKIIPASFNICFILIKERPSTIITTGAAPGLITIALGRLLGIKTIWIDSVANVATMSTSGKLARKLANYVYTQWPELATGRVHYAGNIFGD